MFNRRLNAIHSFHHEKRMMRYRLAVEDMEPNHFVCWVLDLPGSYSSARSKEDAVALAPSRITEYFAWIRRHDPASPATVGSVEVELVEDFKAYKSIEDRDYLINAFFDDDRRSLSSANVETGLQLMDWSRHDLLQAIAQLTSEQLHRPIEGEVRGSVLGILEHVCGAENWYFGQFDLSINWAALPSDVHGKLEAVRDNTRTQLSKLVGKDRITESCGEKWSARKILRRTLWHERAHKEQIVRLAS